MYLLLLKQENHNNNNKNGINNNMKSDNTSDTREASLSLIASVKVLLLEERKFLPLAK